MILLSELCVVNANKLKLQIFSSSTNLNICLKNIKLRCLKKINSFGRVIEVMCLRCKISQLLLDQTISAPSYFYRFSPVFIGKHCISSSRISYPHLPLLMLPDDARSALSRPTMQLSCSWSACLLSPCLWPDDSTTFPALFFQACNLFAISLLFCQNVAGSCSHVINGFESCQSCMFAVVALVVCCRCHEKHVESRVALKFSSESYTSHQSVSNQWELSHSDILLCCFVDLALIFLLLNLFGAISIS